MHPQDLLKSDRLSEIIVFAAALAVMGALLAMAVVAWSGPAL